MDNIRSSHLEELKGSDFQIVEEMPNIQGWKIVDYTGEKVGKVRDMLFDKGARKVRYIITKLEGDKEVLIPIGKAQLDVYNSEVIIQGITLPQLAGLPTYSTNNLTAEDEQAIQHVFRTDVGEGIAAETGDTAYNRDTFYNNEHFNQDQFYKKSDRDRASDDFNEDPHGRVSNPETTGKVPASGVMSETYKEDVNPQDELGSSSYDPQDPEESNRSREEDLDSYPLEEADESAERNVEEEREQGNSGRDINPPLRDDDEFLK